MKKLLIRLILTFLALFLLILSGAAYLLGTESGAQFTVAQLEKLLDDSLQVGSTKGNILDRLELRDILFTNSSGSTKVGHLVLDWKSTELFRLHVHVLEFTTDGLSYTVLPQEDKLEPANDDALSLPELNLPIKITVDKLSLSNSIFLSAPDTETITINKAELSMSWDTQRIHLQNLTVVMDEAALQASGTLNPTGDYPLQLKTSIKTLISDLPSLTVAGHYSGDLQKTISMQQDISGDIRASLTMDVQNILDELAWKGQVEITELRPDVFVPDTPGIVSGSFSSNGNLKQAEVISSLQIRDENSAAMNWDAELSMGANLDTLLFDIKRLTLSHPQTKAQMVLTGTASIEQELDFLLQWQKLQWPLTGDAEYETAKGVATLNGTLEDFRLLLTATVTGSQIPEGDITLNAEGNTAGFDSFQLSLSLLDGVLDLEGKTQWSPMLTWDVHTEAKHINPGIHYTDWPGKLDLRLQSNGKFAENGLTANLKIESLAGQLRNLPISGTGDIAIHPDTLRIQKFQISSGSAIITAHGNLGDQSKLQWKVDINDFSDLLPRAAGQLRAKGSVDKNMTAPLVSFNLSGSAISYSELMLEQLDAAATLDLSWSTPFDLSIKATNLQYGENLVKTVTAKTGGTREKHDLQLEVSHDLVDASLTLKGAYIADEWQGLLDSCALVSADFGTWKSRKPAAVSATFSSATLDTLCLKREASDVCLKGAWDGESGNSHGDIQIHEIPLTWLEPWFPETLEDLTGLFSAQATAAFHDTLEADILAGITPGTINYISEKRAITLPHEGVNLKLNILKDALTADFLLSVDSNIIKGKIQSPDLLQKDIGGKAKLNAELLMDAKNFDLIEALIPDVEDLDGFIDLDFAIRGTIAEPDINGKGQINIAHVLIPLAGLDLTDTTLDILAANKEVTVKGKFASPGGEMLLDGHLDLSSGKNMPVRATLKADNFRLIHLPEIEVFLSSDILFEKKDDLMSLTGEATIPKADILLRELPPGSQSVSPDMVIIQEKKNEDPKSPFHMLLKITLGNDVHFAGFGLNAFIDGQLTLLANPEEQMKGSGAFHIKQGSFRAYGQDLDIETGVISFPGGPLSQPGINLRATRTVGGIVAGIYAIGPARKPRLTTFSNPPMSESNVISYILTGSAPNDAGTGARLSIGRQINNKLSVSVGTDVKTGDSEFITRYRLNRKVHVETTTGSSSNAVDIFYTIELEDDDVKVPMLSN